MNKGIVGVMERGHRLLVRAADGEVDVARCEPLAREVEQLPERGSAEVSEMKKWAAGILRRLASGWYAESYQVNTARCTWLYCFQRIDDAYAGADARVQRADDVSGLELFDWAAG